MILADTSIWIEFLKGHSPYLEILETFIEKGELIAIEPIFGELLQGVLNRAEGKRVKEYWQSLAKIDCNEIWIEAGDYSSHYKLHAKGVGLIDTVILIAARRGNAKVWSLDKKLLSILEKDEIYNL